MNEIEKRLSDYFATSATAASVVSAYLFGSEASGRAHADSDVDVAVLLDRERLPQRADRARAAVDLTSDLIAVLHRNEIDVVVLDDVSPELAVRALEEGRRVFCRDPEADFRFRLQARLRYIDLQPFLRRTRRLKLQALRS